MACWSQQAIDSRLGSHQNAPKGPGLWGKGETWRSFWTMRNEPNLWFFDVLGWSPVWLQQSLFNSNSPEKRPRFFNKRTCGPGSFQVLFRRRLRRVGDLSRRTGWATRHVWNTKVSTGKPITIHGVLPIFHWVNADFARKNRPIPSDSCFSNRF